MSQWHPQNQHFQVAPRNSRLQAPARGRPPYPAHLVRFPSQALPRSRRSRGPSLFQVVYLGTHPVALLLSLVISLFAGGLVCAWIVLVAVAWAMWCAAVTLWWAVLLPFAARR